ncbi:MAG: hypothetical protein HRU49_14370 [Winogradskyella sp.]|uniref:hypothetical protein n=1 Tax=Winogradskyella sp. TaxID=1883156 RepID=UPI0025F3254F|nr:hypothetical protein [Winogradskyella sp.]NRB84933.1 hypothetical protein [Winogradskyella sp.]
MKKTGISGNSIPNYKTIPVVTMDKNGETKSEITSDCPTMMLWFEKNQYQLVCWDWVPGPGPGDFELNFKDENSVVDFIESYYFGKNEYFEKRLEYELNKKQ